MYCYFNYMTKYYNLRFCPTNHCLKIPLGEPKGDEKYLTEFLITFNDAYLHCYFSYFSTNTYVVGTQSKCNVKLSEHTTTFFLRRKIKIITFVWKIIFYLKGWNSMYGKCSKISNTLKLRTPKIIAENNF